MSVERRENIGFHRRAAVARRVGWGIFGLLLIGALLGGFGSGPLSSSKVHAAGGHLMVEHERFQRFQADMRLRVHFQVPEGKHRAALWIDRDYADSLNIRELQPFPIAAQVGTDRLTYEFSPTPNAELVLITLTARPRRAGRHIVRLGVVDGPAVEFIVFVWR
jgi:hypothetical protein